MAIYKIFPLQDTTLYSILPDSNTGLDAMCEVSNTLDISGNAQVARYISLYDNLEITDIIDNTISGSQYSAYIRNFISTAKGIGSDVSLDIQPVAQSWDNGTGYFGDSPAETDGASWNSASVNSPWSVSGNVGGYNYTSSGAGGNWFTTSSLHITQSFGLRSQKDLELNITPIVNSWYSGSIPNYGLITKLSSSFEFNPIVEPSLKYYSVDTNTIYPPHLEFRWRDYETILTASATSSIVTSPEIKISLAENPTIFYPESINRFYLNVSPLYPTRTFQTSSYFTDIHYLPTSSYFAIKDLDTNDYVCTFDETYTQISSDSKGNYFTVYMSGLEPERYYQIIIKSEINGSTILFDDNYYFKVVN
jgi:hypothetical protein